MITTPMLFGNWNATSVPVFLLRPARSKIKLAGLFWPTRNYSRNTTLTKSWHIHTPSRTEHTFTHHMLWFLPLPTIRETLLLRTVQHQTRTGVRSIPNIRSELVFPNIRSPEHTFDHPCGNGRPWTSTLVGAASAHRSCIGAASSSCNWPAGSCSWWLCGSCIMGRARSCVWELRRAAVKFFHRSCKFVGAAKAAAKPLQTYRSCIKLSQM